jgi:TolB-like protein/Tfp pilus assembly protein PilF
MSKQFVRFYEFSPYRLDTSERQLVHGEEVVPVTPKAIQLLLVLVQNHGRIVTKEELLDKVWPETFVGETTLSQNILTLRKALGGSDSKHEYIETIPKRGYRFIAPVAEISEEAPDTNKANVIPLPGKADGEGAQEPRRLSLAVLPLVNASDDPQAEYLSDGITENIINTLSRLSQLRVIARSAVFRHKKQDVDVQEVGRALGVQAVLAGRLLKLENRVVINTELVDPANGSHLWGQQYDCNFSDIFNLQREIALKISDSLEIELTGEDRQRLGIGQCKNSETFQLYLWGRYYWHKCTSEGYRKAKDYFEQAIAREPDFALAYSGLADSLSSQSIGFFSFLPPREFMPKALQATRKALELDDTLAEAHSSLAYIKAHYEWDWESAEREFKRAIELAPGYAHAHLWYSNYLLARGRFEEAFAASSKALELEPFTPVVAQHLGYHFLFTRNYQKALEHLKKTLEMDPNFFPVHVITGLVHEKMGNFPEAVGYFQKAATLEDVPPVTALVANACALSGQTSKAQQLLGELMAISKQRYVAPYYIARIYIGLGDKDKAFEWLEKAYEDRTEWLAWINVNPELDSIRSDPRFEDLARRVGIAA